MYSNGSEGREEISYWLEITYTNNHRGFMYAALVGNSTSSFFADVNSFFHSQLYKHLFISPAQAKRKKWKKMKSILFFFTCVGLK